MAEMHRLVLASKGIGELTVMVQFTGKITQEFHRGNALGFNSGKNLVPP
jgi:hypothetical protein